MARSSSRRVAPDEATAAAASDGRWSPEQAAEYAARRDFRLIQLLSTDRRAFAAARRLGIFASKAKMRHHEKDTSGKPSKGGAPEQQRGTDTGRAPNSKQRRSAARAAAHREALAANAAPAPTPRPATASAAAPPAKESDVEMETDEAELARIGHGRPSAPASPSRHARVEHALLRDASDALAARSTHAPHTPRNRRSGKGSR